MAAARAVWPPAWQEQQQQQHGSSMRAEGPHAIRALPPRTCAAASFITPTHSSRQLSRLLMRRCSSCGHRQGGGRDRRQAAEQRAGAAARRVRPKQRRVSAGRRAAVAASCPRSQRAPGCACADRRWWILLGLAGRGCRRRGAPGDTPSLQAQPGAGQDSCQHRAQLEGAPVELALASCAAPLPWQAGRQAGSAGCECKPLSLRKRSSQSLCSQAQANAPVCSCVAAKCCSAACISACSRGKAARTSGSAAKSASSAGPRPRTSAPADCSTQQAYCCARWPHLRQGARGQACGQRSQRARWLHAGPAGCKHATPSQQRRLQARTTGG